MVAFSKIAAPLMGLCRRTRDDTADVFLGTGSDGHTTPGATRPFGLVTVGPSNGVFNSWTHCSGYHYDSTTFHGLTHTALSGTGLGDLGDLLVTPLSDDLTLDHNKECAVPGLYVLELNDSAVEATATRRAGLIRLTCGSARCGVVINAGWGQNSKTTKASLQVLENVIVGERWSNGFGRRNRREPRSKGRKVFFACAVPNDAMIVREGLPESQVKVVTNHRSLVVKCGLSATSTENAKANLDAEVRDDDDFNGVVEDARREWHRILVDEFQVESSILSPIVLRSALYHTLVAPQTISDVDGTAPGKFGPSAGRRASYSTLSTWDTFRTQAPWLTLFAPDVAADIAASMVSFAGTTMRLPKWLLFDKETDVMIAYHGVTIVADAVLKGLLTDDFAADAIIATVTDAAQKEPAARFHDRGERIPVETTAESVSTGLELTVDDACAARALRVLQPNHPIINRLEARGKLYPAYFDNKTGFFRGSTGAFDPLEFHYANRVHARDFTEGSALQYLFVPGLVDVRGLTRLLGGRDRLKRRLDMLFDEQHERSDTRARDVTGCLGQCCIGNEVVHHTPYLYSAIGYPSLTAETLNRIFVDRHLFGSGPTGLPGNDDAGQLSAWLLVNALGIYPTDPCGPKWDLGRPLIDSANITLVANRLSDDPSQEDPSPRVLRIVVHNQGPDNPYVDRVLLNGRLWHKSYLSHRALTSGPVLEFVMTNNPRRR